MRITTSINSILAHEKLMNVSADNVANVNTENFKSTDANIGENLNVNTKTSQNGTDLTKEITDEIVIKDGFKAQVSSIKTEDEMTKTLLDIKV